MNEDIEKICDNAVVTIKNQLPDRAYRGANELRNASLLVLRGQRSGRRYKVPGTYRRQRDKTDGKMKRGRYYTASAPGEPPAVRTGVFRMSWQPKAEKNGNTYKSIIESRVKAGDYVLGALLEDGTSKMAPRPHHDAIKQKALPKVLRIYKENYF